MGLVRRQGRARAALEAAKRAKQTKTFLVRILFVSLCLGGEFLISPQVRRSAFSHSGVRTQRSSLITNRSPRTRPRRPRPLPPPQVSHLTLFVGEIG